MTFPFGPICRRFRLPYVENVARAALDRPFKGLHHVSVMPQPHIAAAWPPRAKIMGIGGRESPETARSSHLLL
jgi:hypothetical protein